MLTGKLSTPVNIEGEIYRGVGASDYNDLENRPSINNIILEGNKTTQELGIWQPFDLIPNTEYNTGIKWNNQSLYCMIMQESFSGNYITKVVPIDGTATPIFNIWNFKGGNGNYLVDDPDYFKYRQVWSNKPNELSFTAYKNDADAYGANNLVNVIVFYTKTV